jgi:hypothetical protein
MYRVSGSCRPRCAVGAIEIRDRLCRAWTRATIPLAVGPANNPQSGASASDSISGIRHNTYQTRQRESKPYAERIRRHIRNEQPVVVLKIRTYPSWSRSGMTSIQDAWWESSATEYRQGMASWGVQAALCQQKGFVAIQWFIIPVIVSGDVQTPKIRKTYNSQGFSRDQGWLIDHHAIMEWMDHVSIPRQV